MDSKTRDLMRQLNKGMVYRFFVAPYTGRVD